MEQRVVITGIVTVTCLAVTGCGSGGHTVPAPTSVGSGLVDPRAGIFDLDSPAITTATGGGYFSPTGVSDSGIVSGFNSSDTELGGLGPPANTYVLSPTSATPYKFSGVSELVVSRSGLILTATSPGTNGVTFSTPPTANAQAVGGSSIPLMFAEGQEGAYPAASAVSNIIVGEGDFTADDYPRAVKWEYKPGNSSHPAHYAPTVLASLPDRLVAESVDVSKDGVIVGNSRAAPASYFGDNTTRATLWERSGQPTDIGVLPGASFSAAVAINDSNVVVGNSGTLTPNSTVISAFRYTVATGMVALPPLQGDAQTLAVGVTNTGDVFGVSRQVDDTGNNILATHGVVWKNGIPADLSTSLGGGLSAVQVVAVCASGRLIVLAQSSSGQYANYMVTP